MISAILKAKPESLRGNAVRRFVIEKDKDAKHKGGKAETAGLG